GDLTDPNGARYQAAPRPDGAILSEASRYETARTAAATRAFDGESSSWRVPPGPLTTTAGWAGSRRLVASLASEATLALTAAEPRALLHSPSSRSGTELAMSFMNCGVTPRG